ncbi:hypothetical protein [Alteribacillus sp. YIM 98480]|uniref:hypothetical protein n=1 Tax=Alteribacillus sp. YIM 98480 TaxID=2606599 RepID=UPI00131C4B2A|nr:hypothetical protein [Alteribacillus sp. YIM 98480]
MKKRTIMTALAATLMLSACSESSANEETEMEAQEQETEEVAVNEKENKSRPYIEGEAKANNVHQTVHNVIVAGHAAMMKYIEVEGRTIGDDADLGAALEKHIPMAEEAIENAEGDALIADLADIYNHSVSLQKEVEEANDVQNMDEQERKTRVMDLLRMYRDLDYYIRGVEEYEPYNITRVAKEELSQEGSAHRTGEATFEKLEEEEVQESLEQLPENLQSYIKESNHPRDRFVFNEEYRQAIVEAYEQYEDMNKNDLDMMWGTMMHKGHAKEEAIEILLELREGQA